MIYFIIISTLILWLSFIAVTKIVDDASSRDDLNIFQKAAVFVFIVFIDVPHNYTVSSIIFWELADNDRKTLTARLKHILRSGLYEEDEWRFKLALFMCKYMISPWHFNHCGMGFGDD